MKARFHRQAERGFTLVELMVAMLGGLFVSMAVFTIAKHSSSFSLRQSRISDATLQSVVGFERLRADLSRAGYLSTPNMVTDPTICRGNLYPAWLRRLASVHVDDVPGTQLSTEITVNGFQPKRLVLGGSYTSGNSYPIALIDPGPPITVALQPDRLGLAELGFDTTPTAATLQRVFQTGRALRIVDDSGRVQYGAITGVSVTTDFRPLITLAADPGLVFGGPCGIAGNGTRGVANVVNIIRYDLRNLNNATSFPQYAAMFRGGPTYEATRRELIREELDLAGDPYADSLELISEYAVDLGFSLFVRRNDELQAVDPADVPSFAGNPAQWGLGRGPQMIRAVRFWLSTRSQEADRPSADTYVPAVAGPSVLRMSMHPTDPTQPPFARVRTLQSTVPLNNQANVRW